MAILVDQIASRVSRYNDAQFKMVDNRQSLAIFNEGLLEGTILDLIVATIKSKRTQFKKVGILP